MHVLATLLESNITRSVLAALAICVSFIIYRLNKKRKELSYRIVTKTTLFGVDREIGGRVQVLLDGQPADRIGLVLVEIENTGNEPIKADEFVRPLTFTFAPQAQIISAEVTATTPKNLGAKLMFHAATVTVEPLLMNPGDEISAKVLLKEFNGQVDGDARIVGIRDVKRRVTTGVFERTRIQTSLSLLTTMLATLAAAGSAISVDQIKNWLPSTFPFFLSNIFGPLLAFVMGYYFSRAQKVEDESKDYHEEDIDHTPPKS